MLYSYLIQRFLLMFLTLLGMSIIIFVLLRLVPGNIVDIMFDSAGFVDPAEKKTIEKELGLDLPIYEQYYHWIVGLVSFDLGFSYVFIFIHVVCHFSFSVATGDCRHG